VVGSTPTRRLASPRTPTTIIFKKLNPDSALRCVFAMVLSKMTHRYIVLTMRSRVLQHSVSECGVNSPRLARNIRWASMSRAQSGPSSANPRTVIGWSSDLSTPEVCDAPEQVALIGYAAHKPSFISSF
jgi:hypothetical protein